MIKTPFYTVLEKQIDAEGNPATLNTHYTDYAQAMSAFFSICSAAAISLIPYHAAHIIRDDGIMIEGRVFDRREPAPTPEPGDEE